MTTGFAQLSTRQSPPLAVPMRFLLTAPLFLAMVGLVMLLAPAQFATRWNPAVLAAAHLWVLGFMLMVMVGAIQQLVPVLIGVPLTRPMAVSRVLHGLLVFGAGALAAAFFRESAGYFWLAVVLLDGALLVLLTAVLPALRRSPSSHATVQGMFLALAALALTVVLGSFLAMGHIGRVPLHREWTDLHLTWGLAGWTVLLVAAVAWQVVPMFQLTPRYPLWLTRWLGPVLLLGLVTASVGEGVLGSIGAALLSLALLSLAGWTLWLQTRRKRRLADATLDFWRLAMLSLIAAVIGWWARKSGLNLPDLWLGALMAVGFAGSAILGMLYKIVPFLVWLHLTNRAMDQGLSVSGLPNMKQVIPAVRSRWLLRVHLVWVLGLLAIPWLPPSGVRLVGLVGLVEGLLLEWHLGAALVLYRRHLKARG